MGALGILVGLISGVAGASFAIGVDKQRITDALSENSTAITKMENYIDGLTEITTNKYFEQLQSSIGELEGKVNDLCADVKVLQALVDRLEQNSRPKSKP